VLVAVAASPSRLEQFRNDLDELRGAIPAELAADYDRVTGAYGATIDRLAALRRSTPSARDVDAAIAPLLDGPTAQARTNLADFASRCLDRLTPTHR